MDRPDMWEAQAPKEDAMSSGPLAVIERGVAIPTGHVCGFTAAMRQMEIGDSFVVATWRKAATLITLNRRLAPKKFMSRRQLDGSFRIWRVQ
jgi:hypothetical protein